MKREHMKSLLRTIAGFSMAMNLLWLFPALYSLQVFDRVLSSRSVETLLVLLGGVAITLVIIGLMDFLRGRLQGVLGNIINDSMAPEIARVTLEIGARRMGRFSNEGLRDVGRLRAMFSSQGLVAIMDAPWAIVYIGVISVANIWLGLLSLCAALLMLGYGGTWLLGRALSLSREDRITLLYGGAHKSAAMGVPLAAVLFPAVSAGAIIVPLLAYHLSQLIVAAPIAAKLAGNRPDA